MPNYCYTEITITGENMDELYSLVNNWLENPDPDETKTWLGNIVNGSGVNTKETRGSISDMKLVNKKELFISTITAWAPILSVWRLVCEKYTPGAEIRYIADETYETNIDEYVGNYSVDIFDSELGTLVANAEKTKEILKKAIKEKELDIDTDLPLDELIEEIEDASLGSIHEYEYCSIYDL